MANEMMSNAVNYMLNQWKSPENFIKDGRVQISNNLCEQRMKPVKLNLKNCQNIGSENAAEKTPSDALVINTLEYQRVLGKALSYTSDKNAIVTIGIKPSRPETGYGYIAAAEPTSADEIYKVEAFKEKPNLETAEQYLAASNYYWNAGIFVWNIDTISKAIHTFQPNLASIMDEMVPSLYT